MIEIRAAVMVTANQRTANDFMSEDIQALLRSSYLAIKFVAT